MAVSALIDEALLAGPGAVAQAKRLLRDLAGTPVSPALLSELQDEFDVLFKSPEAAEGRASFRDKRRPSWYPEPATKP